jgi:hypothetical protein
VKGFKLKIATQTTETFIHCLENTFRFLGGVTRTAIIDNLGAAVTLLALGQKQARRPASVINVLLGAWLIASAFVFAVAAPVPFWNNILAGAAIVILALLAGSVHTRATVTPPAR